MRLSKFRLHLRLTASLALFAALAGCSTLSSWTPDMFKSAPPQPAASAVQSSGVHTTRERRFLGVLSPYRVDIQQGNFISREMVAQLKEAMQTKEGVSRDQVKFVLGTPLVTDVFHEDRWDYAFRLEKADGEVIQSRVTVYFENNRLTKLDGGDLPSERDYLAMIAGKEAAPPPPQESNGLDSPRRDPKSRRGD